MNLPDEHPMLTERAAAEYLGLKNHNTLAVWRTTKRYDLTYVKVGRLVRYRKEDLDAFLERRKVTLQALPTKKRASAAA